LEFIIHNVDTNGITIRKATEVNAIHFQKHSSMQRKENINIRQQIALNHMPSPAQFTNF
jgi:hypothetical protein